MILKGLLHALSRKSEEFLVFLHLPLKKKKQKKPWVYLETSGSVCVIAYVVKSFKIMICRIRAEVRVLWEEITNGNETFSLVLRFLCYILWVQAVCLPDRRGGVRDRVECVCVWTQPRHTQQNWNCWTRDIQPSFLLSLWWGAGELAVWWGEDGGGA